MREAAVAFIPARAGSKRIPGKNLRLLHGHPLLAYAIAGALAADAFADVLVSTEDEQTAAVARHYGAGVIMRPAEYSGDTSPDIDWVRHALDELRRQGRPAEVFAILRPTSPLRRPATIAAAVEALVADEAADSLRAVELVRQHPGKMWVSSQDRRRITPLLDDFGAQPPWHSSAYQALPEVYAQNASLEVARSRAVDVHGSIAGTVVRPWFSQDDDGFDLNDERDWALLELLLSSGAAVLPDPAVAPWTPATIDGALT